MIRTSILSYKFKDKSYLYQTFTNFLLKNKKFFQILKSYDTIVPVPISNKRKKERGYNQSYLIAREVAIRTNIQLINNCIYKKINTVEQSKLNKEERNKNLKGVYRIKNKGKLFDKKILLLDDVYTTGNTVKECCKTLMEAMPKRIDVLTIAKD